MNARQPAVLYPHNYHNMGIDIYLSWRNQKKEDRQ
jgi:hypothetical protein